MKSEGGPPGLISLYHIPYLVELNYTSIIIAFNIRIFDVFHAF